MAPSEEVEIADEEINALALTSLFGWQWMCKSEDGLVGLIAPDNDVFLWKPVNWHAPDWIPSSRFAPRFRHWDKMNTPFAALGYGSALPDFCTDRNLLPLLWAKVRKAQAEYEFGEEIYLMVGPYVSCSQWGIRASLIDIMGLTPRQQTKAVLRTLGRWPSEWEGEAK